DYKEGQQLGLNVKLMDAGLENLCRTVVDSVEECIGFMPQHAGNTENRKPHQGKEREIEHEIKKVDRKTSRRNES
ncbi:unnamed protein product, partial [marine sediment metagenome]